MRIENSFKTKPASDKKTRPRSSQTSNFTPEEVSRKTAPAPIPAPGVNSSLEGILALQEMSDRPARKQAISRGTALLDVLDEMKIGVLGGQLDDRHLERLSTLIEGERASLDDPRLENLLDHIDLRAKVELAKRRRN